MPSVPLDSVYNGSPSPVLREEAEVIRGKSAGRSELVTSETKGSFSGPHVTLCPVFSLVGAPWLQAPVQSPQRSVDSISQESSTSSFSSMSAGSRQEETKKDYREVRLPEGGRGRGGLGGPRRWRSAEEPWPDEGWPLSLLACAGAAAALWWLRLVPSS